MVPGLHEVSNCSRTNYMAGAIVFQRHLIVMERYNSATPTLGRMWSFRCRSLRFTEHYQLIAITWPGLTAVCAAHTVRCFHQCSSVFSPMAST
ncbi:uncharacterized protein YALI1_C11843g [Yarrowia lipolytica]|uniref:Uncharacterized protein n=1 Tax=Yarrowia lipolytica TaxID=4952 RepID=A0A1D8NA79_YARLL|nr:hypothetical protein YALI1_C11843g [Yarrowia lipolytica]